MGWDGKTLPLGRGRITFVFLPSFPPHALAHIPNSVLVSWQHGDWKRRWHCAGTQQASLGMVAPLSYPAWAFFQNSVGPYKQDDLSPYSNNYNYPINSSSYALALAASFQPFFFSKTSLLSLFSFDPVLSHMTNFNYFVTNCKVL